MHRLDDSADGPAAQEPVDIDATEGVELLLRDLRATPVGLSAAEARRRLIQYGPNELRRRGGLKWPGELARQLTHPLALLLWLAAALSFAVGSHTIAIAVLLVIVLNAVFAFVQEMQAERAVEALAEFLPQHVRVLREGQPSSILAAELVPGDVVTVEEGDRIAADMRLISGAVEVDLSTLTGESAPALRSAELGRRGRTADRRAGSPVQRHECHRRKGAGRRVCDRDAHRAGTYRRALGASQGRAKPPGATSSQGRLADRGDRDHDGRRLRSDRDLRCGTVVQEQRRVRGRPAGRKRAGGTAASDHAGAGCRGALARSPGRAGQALERRGDPWLHRRHLHRQDRDTDREPHATDFGLDRGERGRA